MHIQQQVYVEKRFASLQHQQLLRGYSSRADFTKWDQNSDGGGGGGGGGSSGGGGGGGGEDGGMERPMTMPLAPNIASRLIGNAGDLISLNNGERWSSPLTVQSDAESDAFGTPDVSVRACVRA